ncbi:MAG: hypothetical protein KZQ76_08425 [Candidatus Thiodiazotropha sp. (ex Epidulcina cf. delphinae)]|nr:hypothetical protein [Candidatus Thiodiazotropha sp. (ex Epidulcina cf. delphinae)]
MRVNVLVKLDFEMFRMPSVLYYRSMSRLSILFLLSVFTMVSPVSADEGVGSSWAAVDNTGALRVDLWFFWSEHCPHCQDARPHVEALPEALPWLRLHSLKLEGHPEHVAHYKFLAGRVGGEARSVPAMLFCTQMMVGWESFETTGKRLREGLMDCYARLAAGVEMAPDNPKPLENQPAPRQQGVSPIILPIVGEVDIQAWSLPAFTLVLAGLDSFNPCAFFVLLFLLSLLVHAGSRGRMLAVGGLFIAVSGLVYFLSMAAWLNLFSLVGHLYWVTLGAGLLALAIGVFNVKDYFLFQQGPSLSIPAKAKPKLFARMRDVVSAGSMPAMLAAAALLAVIANLYELLCTAGFPMVYTRVLTLSALPVPSYYRYLALYNLIYILPLLTIMLVFVFTLGSRKLRESEGRVLKLLSGLMMLGLGAVLVFVPGALDRLWTAVLLLLAAVVATWFLVKRFPGGVKAESKGSE